MLSLYLWIPESFLNEFLTMDAICKHATYMHLLEELMYKMRFSRMLLTNILAEISISLAPERAALSQESICENHRSFYLEGVAGGTAAALKHGV